MLQLLVPNQRLEVAHLTTKRILVVDDEASVREIVTVCLQRLGGWDVVAVASGREALKQAIAAEPDAIVLDLLMPEMDGLTFLQRLRSDPVTESIPVVLLTANSYPPNAQLLSQLGVVLVVSKPFFPKDLIQQITEAMAW